MARHNFREIQVWQKARILVKDVYLITEDFPNEEKYGLCSQLKRAVVSIAANISEGSGRGTDKDFAHFLNLSEGSSNETITLLIPSADLGFLKNEDSKILIGKLEEINRMINGFRKKIYSV